MGSRADINVEDVVARKRAHRQACIPQEWLLSEATVKLYAAHPIQIFKSPLVEQVLTPRDLEITNTNEDATDRVEHIHSGRISCLETVLAFCKRAAIGHQLTNCLSEIMFDSALSRARELDQIPVAQRKALHGLPVTVKDSFFIKGYDSSIGIAALCDRPAQTNSMIVQVLEDLGAVIIAKMTVPQTMLTADTDSVVFGRTTNAHNGSMGAAGSTGGEGALIAMGGSALGFGTDGAGSVRMPAFVNALRGVCGTTQLGPTTVAGPLTRSVRDAQLVFRLFWQARLWERDPMLLPSPWLNLSLPPRMRIGVWTDHDHVHPLPPVARAFRLAQQRLAAAAPDVELLPFAGFSIATVWKLQKEFCELLDLRYLKGLVDIEGAIEIVRRTGILYLPESSTKSQLDVLEQLHDLNSQIMALVRGMGQAWNAHGQPLDAVLWIPAPHPAVPFDEYTDLTFTALFNVIDWPAIVLPTGDYADSKLDASTNGPVAEQDLFGDEDRRVQSLYFGHEESFDGLPLSVQLIGRRGQDEKLLAIASKMHDIIKAR
ncbi:hypothetical protein LTR10_024140 [Elasticomyces elasticus]|uniref:Amidase domain-containing protein n=1 Tax=Exophiala sideris TaxID=1016849 RepID=A0ABR0JQK6_9EURO|nr:hypothetical protein LTR10_024140 [Elasticomyces elasticus]KAK5038225.1 hypothetical protein LTS07_001694 [Exophiala sideris]KAK5044209.1 hypothetical protein LTR13_000565 [Exophiala sideris]KAK5067709.1 hypothetical protein LTR69_001698 [Exophiala sideris]KAK5184051.1 hypothetical protein LTR44_003557 [Eurotiomycetes sp. CCFEE 6388]